MNRTPTYQTSANRRHTRAPRHDELRDYWQLCKQVLLVTTCFVLLCLLFALLTSLVPALIPH